MSKVIYNPQEGFKKVSNEVADEKVKKGGWKFVPKKGWKEAVRDVNRIK